jgi:hypothetical protein
MKIFMACSVLLLCSCTAIQQTSDKIESSHYSLYNQKILIVTSLEKNKVFFTNPANTRYYFLKGKKYTTRWQPGDTFVVDKNLDCFYKLKYHKNK